MRPTGDRIREAWISILQDSLPGARVLDLFSGSGALGLEALSRGAASAEFVELSPPSLAALKANIASLGVEATATVHRGDALRFAERLAPATYDIVFADPPYDTGQADRLVEVFRRTAFARILGVEHEATHPLPGDDTRRYGRTALTFCYAP